MIFDGWVDWADRAAGPVNKVYVEANTGAGIVCHSMEGTYQGSFNELLNPSRQASWMFSLRKNGKLVQHYRVTASPWASGNKTANTSLWSVEAEGVAGQPLTDEQSDTLYRLCREWEAYHGDGRMAQRVEPRTVWQHNEVWNWEAVNAGATACPSGRYDQFFAVLEAANIPEPEVEPSAVEVLNAAIMKREALRLIASGDIAQVERAVTVLRAAGFAV